MNKRQAIELALRLRAQCQTWNEFGQNTWVHLSESDENDEYFVKLTSNTPAILHIDKILGKVGVTSYWFQADGGVPVVVIDKHPLS